MTHPPHDHNLENWPEGTDISVLIVDGKDCDSGYALFESNCSRMKELLDKACRELPEAARVFVQNQIADGYDIPVNCFGQLHAARQKIPPTIPELRQRAILVNDVYYFLDRAYLPWESRSDMAVVYNPPCPHVLQWRTADLGGPPYFGILPYFGIVAGTLDGHYEVKGARGKEITLPCHDLLFQSLLAAGDPDKCASIEQGLTWKVADGTDLFCLKYADDMSRVFQLLKYDPDTKKLIGLDCPLPETRLAPPSSKDRPQCFKFGYGISPFYMDLFVPIVHGSAEECIIGPEQFRVFDARFMTGSCITDVSIESTLSRVRVIGSPYVPLPCDCEGKISNLVVKEEERYLASLTTYSCRVRDSLDGHALNLDELPIPPFVNRSDFHIDLGQLARRQVSEDMLPLYMMNIKECFDGTLAGFSRTEEKVTDTSCVNSAYGDYLAYETSLERTQFPHSDGSFLPVWMGVDPTYFATMQESGTFPQVGVFLRVDEVVNSLPDGNNVRPIYDVANGYSTWSVRLEDFFFGYDDYGLVIPVICCNSAFVGWTSGNKTYTGTVRVSTEANTSSSANCSRDFCYPSKNVSLKTEYVIEVLMDVHVYYNEGAYVDYQYGNPTLARMLKGAAIELLGEADSVDRDCITAGYASRYFLMKVESGAMIRSLTALSHYWVYSSWLASYKKFGCGECTCGDLVPLSLTVNSGMEDKKFVYECEKDMVDICGLDRSVVGDDLVWTIDMCETGILANSVREAAKSLSGSPPCPINWCFSMKDAYLPTIGWNEKSDGCILSRPAFYCDYVSEYGNIYDCEPNKGRVKERCANEPEEPGTPGPQPGEPGIF